MVESHNEFLILYFFFKLFLTREVEPSFPKKKFRLLPIPNTSKTFLQKKTTVSERINPLEPVIETRDIKKI